jgi:alpha-glucan phosphorylase-like protein
MAAGKNYSGALAETKAHCHFTTHTPVEAGHDRFSPDLMNYAMQRYCAQLSLPFADILGLGRVNPQNAQETFCMTVLALKLSRAANGVSELHGQVSREMWHSLYPNVPVEKVPIGHITNGIHLLGWMKALCENSGAENLRMAAVLCPKARRSGARARARTGRPRSTNVNSGRRCLTRNFCRTRNFGLCATSCAAN